MACVPTWTFARAMPVENESVDCYISQGVIEHYLNGFDAILDEMDRVLKPHGIALIAFPSMDLVRSCKVACRAFPIATCPQHGGYDFCQFALDPYAVRTQLVNRGYKILEMRRYEGVLGLRSESPWPLRHVLSWWYNNRTSHVFSLLRRVAEPAISPWAGYCMQIAARKSVAG